MNNAPRIRVLLFDVNETLLDITVLEPFFSRVFGQPEVLRTWFAELVLYSQSMTLAGLYEPFGNLAVAALRMVASNHGLSLGEDEVARFRSILGNLPAHPDVVPALKRFQDAGFRLATLTNSAPTPSPTALEKAGISHFFEAHFSVDTVGVFKPHPATYEHAVQQLAVKPEQVCLVACHLWDTIGAQAAGCSGAFVTRPNNSLLVADKVPRPDFVAHDLADLADQLTGPHT